MTADDLPERKVTPLHRPPCYRVTQWRDRDGEIWEQVPHSGAWSADGSADVFDTVDALGEAYGPLAPLDVDDVGALIAETNRHAMQRDLDVAEAEARVARLEAEIAGLRSTLSRRDLELYDLRNPVSPTGVMGEDDDPRIVTGSALHCSRCGERRELNPNWGICRPCVNAESWER